MTFPLEPSPSEMHRLVDLAMERIVAHVSSLDAQPAADTEGANELARSLAEPLPRSGASYESLLDLLFDELVPKTFNAAGPGYLAYIPGGGIFHSAVADLISDSFNRYIGVWAASPPLVQLEANVVRWFGEIVGYGAGSGGVLTTGGSLANFTAIVAARKSRLPENFLAGVLYASDQVHHSVNKAASLAGFPDANVRAIETDERFRMRTDRLREAIEQDRAAGRTPFCVVASAGTTNSGAVDDLETIAAIARENGLWMHVDGAYGAFFMLTERGRRAMKGIELADSISLDPHKSLFVPYGTGSLVVRDAESLRRAHSSTADYMPQMQAERDLVDFCEISPELSRDFRGLRIWLPFKMFGIAPFVQQLDEKLDLTLRATEELRKIAGIEIVAEPQLSIVAFRLAKPDLGREELNALNRDFVGRINARKRVMLTGTVLRGDFVLRICVLSFRTHADRMEMALEDIRSAVEELR